MKRIFFAIFLLALPVSLVLAIMPKKEVKVGLALSDFPVGFSLLTHGDKQFVAYYDPNHVMTVAMRNIESDEWTYETLPSKVGWDSHNSIVMAIDNEGYLHLSGNMHSSPLVYFRSTKPLDITTFEEINKMTGENENRVTYPIFSKGPDGELIYQYRDGSSGNGKTLFNVYDVKTRKWTRLLSEPLVDGEGLMNAYLQGPTLGPDGYYHIIWVWRDTPDCETSHDLYYARSRNLKDWESVDGKSVTLPITVRNKELLVDSVPVNGGLINGGGKIGFDGKNRVVIVYHKFDAKGNTQAYITSFQNGKWQIKQISDWDYRWAFSGRGSISFDISLVGATTYFYDVVRVGFRHKKYGSDFWLIDENTLEKLDKNSVVPKVAAKKSQYSSLVVNAPYVRQAVLGIGESSEGKTYRMEWKSLPQNRDSKHDGELAEPTDLIVVEED